MRALGAGVLMMGLALSASGKDLGQTEQATPPKSVDGKASAAKVGVKAKARSKSWFEIGVASWYGKKFQGRRTSDGERFDMQELTCAHPTLPMGTWLRVTNLKNHQTTFVRVNDRGPVIEGRIVDLSMAAARAVGLAGIGRVKLERVSEGDPEIALALVAQVQAPRLLPDSPISLGGR